MIENKKIKSELIKAINKAEKLAKDTIEVSLQQDLFQLEQMKIDEEHYKSLLSQYLANVLNSYHKIKNYYKSSNEQFYFLKSLTTAKSEDRVDFIATMLVSTVNPDVETKSEIEISLDVINQIQNIEDIVYETKLLELKKDASKIMIGNLKKATSKKPQKATKQKQNTFLKDLFKNPNEEYNKVINALIENEFITTNDNGTLNWKGIKVDTTLTPKTSICTLAIILDSKDYFETNLNYTIIAKALTNTFNGINITGKTFGTTKNNFLNKPHYSNAFYFIN